MFEIGTTLRDARIRRDISLQRAEDDTKIRIKYIQAMENEDFGVLPGGTYVKGFLRTYAEYLGIDYQPLLDEYNEHFGTGEHRDHIIHSAGAPTVSPATSTISSSAHGDPTPRNRRSQKNRNYVFVALLAVVIILVLAYLGWGSPASNQPTLVTTTEMEGTTTTAPAAAPVTETAPRTTTTSTQSATLDSIEITSTKTDNWVEVREEDSSGEVIWAGTLSAGDSKTIDKTKLKVTKAWLKVGSAVGLQVSVNGKDQEVPQKTGAAYEITAAGMGQA